MKVQVNGQTFEVEVKGGVIQVNGTAFEFVAQRVGQEATVEIGGTARRVELKGDTVVVDGVAYQVTADPALARPSPAPAAVRPAAPSPRPAGRVPAQPKPAAPAPPAPPPAAKPEAPPPTATPSAGGTAVKAPMPGKILRVLVEPGANVPFGGVMLVLEAMKMENEIRTTAPGVVKAVHVTAGSTVNAGDTLVTIEG